MYTFTLDKPFFHETNSDNSFEGVSMFIKLTFKLLYDNLQLKV